MVSETNGLHRLTVFLLVSALLVTPSCDDSTPPRPETGEGVCPRIDSVGFQGTRVDTREEMERLHDSECPIVEGPLFVAYVPGVEDLRLLEHIEEAGALVISETQDLRTLDGIEQMRGFEFGVYLLNNQVLRDTSALAGPMTGPQTQGPLYVQSNDELRTLGGMGQFETLRAALVVEDNDKLESLGTLDTDFTYFGSSIVIRDNPKLPSCNLDEFVNRISEGREEGQEPALLTIEDNAGCE